jgi:ribonuclease HII
MKDLITICGIDEAGRGALAGPLVCAAVVLPKGWDFRKANSNVPVRDSKKLSSGQRERLFEVISRYAMRVETEVISVEEINNFGIAWANKEGFRRLILRIEASEYICDGILRLEKLGKKRPRTHSVIDADETVPAVLSAGVVAKVERDKIMRALHFDYLDYGWDKNTGHGTKQHLRAICKFGSTVYHRHQFVSNSLKIIAPLRCVPIHTLGYSQWLMLGYFCLITFNCNLLSCLLKSSQIF